MASTRWAQRVHKCGGCVRLATVRWPAAHMDQALRNLVRVGLGWPMPRNVFPPSGRLSGPGRSRRIAPDARADLVVLDAELRLQQVVIGRVVDLT